MSRSEGMSFAAVVALDDMGVYSSFAEAFGPFYHAVKDLVRKGTTWQVVETACFIELRDPNGQLLGAHSFMDAKERAFREGLLTEGGKLVEQVLEP